MPAFNGGWQDVGSCVADVAIPISSADVATSELRQDVVAMYPVLASLFGVGLCRSIAGYQPGALSLHRDVDG